MKIDAVTHDDRAIYLFDRKNKVRICLYLEDLKRANLLELLKIKLNSESGRKKHET